MFKQVVVCVDEHEGGRDAIALACCPLLVLPRAARVIAADDAEDAGREPAVGVNG